MAINTAAAICEHHERAPCVWLFATMNPQPRGCSKIDSTMPMVVCAVLWCFSLAHTFGKCRTKWTTKRHTLRINICRSPWFHGSMCVLTLRWLRPGGWSWWSWRRQTQPTWWLNATQTHVDRRLLGYCYFALAVPYGHIIWYILGRGCLCITCVRMCSRRRRHQHRHHHHQHHCQHMCMTWSRCVCICVTYALHCVELFCCVYNSGKGMIASQCAGPERERERERSRTHTHTLNSHSGAHSVWTIALGWHIKDTVCWNQFKTIGDRRNNNWLLFLLSIVQNQSEFSFFFFFISCASEFCFMFRIRFLDRRSDLSIVGCSFSSEVTVRKCIRICIYLLFIQLVLVSNWFHLMLTIFFLNKTERQKSIYKGASTDIGQSFNH